MQSLIRIIISLLFITSLLSCEKDNPINARNLNCSENDFPTNNHPRASEFQTVIDAGIQSGIVGITAMIQSPEGLWLGAAGKADLATNTDMEICKRAMVASCTKTFTAAIVFKMIEAGLLRLDDQLGDLMPASILKDIENASASEIQHLLSHTSGIADYYTTSFELSRADKYNNNFTQLDILEFTRGVSADHAIGERFTYSNTNYLLLGLLLEEILDQPIQDIFQSQLSQPHGLRSVEYIFELPNDLISGYGAVSNDIVVQSQRYYQDETGSGDGALVSTAYDLGSFIRLLGEGQIVSASSLAKMTEWFDMPSDEQGPEIGFLQNGFGLERYQTEFGNGFGHFGGVDGFNSVMLYFPEAATTVAFILNGRLIREDNFLTLYDDLLEVALR